MHRECKKGGGVGILIKDSIMYKPRPDLQKQTQHNSYEHYFIEIKGSQYNVTVGSIYRPPNTEVDKFLEDFNNSLELISTDIKPDMPINVYEWFCLSTAKSKFSLVSPVAD